MMSPVGYFSGWRWVVASLAAVVVAAVMLLVALSGPADAQTPGPLQSIAAGDQHGLAIVNNSDGSGLLWAWGANGYGQLGRNSNGGDYFPPVRVVGPSAKGYFSGAQAIAAGSWHSLALRNDGTVWAWGRNNYGQLGVNSDNPHYYPVQVHGLGNAQPPDNGLSGITAVAAGSDFNLAVGTGGTVYSWGDGRYGQLGVHSDNTHQYPVQVHGPGNGQPPDNGLSGITAVAAGYNFSLALKNDGTVWAWGDNAYYELGNGGYGTVQTYPVEVRGPGGTGFLSGIVAIAAGAHFSVALGRDGTVWTWGDDSKGELGVNSTLWTGYPVRVHGPDNVGALSGITGVAAGDEHVLALRNDGTVWAWGGNNRGQLGINSDNEHHYPVQVHGLDNGQPPDNGLSGIKYVAAGESFSMALNSAGTAVFAWGNNSDRQIDYSAVGHPYPVQVTNLPSSTTSGAPVLTDATLSATSFLLGSQLPVIARAKAPVGTNIGFTLDRAARVRLLFTHTVTGRRVGGRCVAQTNRNRHRARCQRTLGVALSFHAHAGRTRLHFEGRLDRKRKLAPGRYKLIITATANGHRSKAAILRFRILATTSRTSPAFTG